jgi:hypothetical protein
MEALLPWKIIGITCSVYVAVALVIQHVMRMRRNYIIISCLSSYYIFFLIIL